MLGSLGTPCYALQGPPHFVKKGGPCSELAQCLRERLRLRRGLLLVLLLLLLLPPCLCRSRFWLFLSYVVSFASVVGAVWVLMQHYGELATDACSSQICYLCQQCCPASGSMV